MMSMMSHAEGVSLSSPSVSITWSCAKLSCSFCVKPMKEKFFSRGFTFFSVYVGTHVVIATVGRKMVLPVGAPSAVANTDLHLFRLLWVLLRVF